MQAVKLAPIVNPHAKTGQIANKTKAQERDELIQATRTNAIEKYRQRKTATKWSESNTKSGTGQGFTQKQEFQLEEKINKEYLGKKLLEEGYMTAFIDFFYLTYNKTPSSITPDPKYQEEFRLNRRQMDTFQQTEEKLLQLKEHLVDAETYMREGESRKCF